MVKIDLNLSLTTFSLKVLHPAFNIVAVRLGLRGGFISGFSAFPFSAVEVYVRKKYKLSKNLNMTNTMKLVHSLTTMITIGTLATDANGASIVLSAVADNTIYEPSNFTNGAGDWVFTGNNAGGQSRRALLLFDLSSAGISSGAIINSVTLSLTMDRTLAGSQSVALHRLTNDWGEGSGNASGNEGSGTGSTPGASDWLNNFNGTSAWGTAGGDFISTASATQSVGGDGTYNWSSAGLVTDVESWLTTSGSNFGWIVIGNESSSSTTKRFLSRENAGASPQLTIDFTPIPEPSSALLFGLGSLAFVARRRRSC